MLSPRPPCRGLPGGASPGRSRYCPHGQTGTTCYPGGSGRLRFAGEGGIVGFERRTTQSFAHGPHGLPLIPPTCDAFHLLYEITQMEPDQTLEFGLGQVHMTAGDTIFQPVVVLLFFYQSIERSTIHGAVGIDELFSLQEKTLDEDKRIEFMHEVQAILAEQTPLIYLPIPETYTGVKNRWKNVKLPRSGVIFWNIEEIWTDQPQNREN